MNETNLLIIFGVGIIALWVMFFYITKHKKHKPG